MPPPRRGRGGARGWFRGRGRRRQPGAEKPAEYKPRDRYPTTLTPKLVGLRKSERAEIEHYRRLRKAFQDGPLYTVLDHSNLSSTTTTMTTATARPGSLPGMRNFGQRDGVSNVKDADPFEALPTFSQKFKKPRRPVPQLQAGDYIKAFFPVELHQYIDSTSAPQTTLSSRARKKLTAEEEEELLEDEEDMLMEEEDDDFEEDEDDDDDYNAENYFSDGKSDAGGDDGGGGDEF